MKQLAKALTGLAALVFVSQAHSAFMIEPFLGYQTGEYSIGSSKADIAGTEFGLRLGGTTSMLSYGVEYAVGALERDKSSSFSKQDVDTTDMGLFIGFEFPILIRAYATYFVKSAADVSTFEYTGTGMRLGVGYTGLPFVSINLEKISRTYDKEDGDSLSTDTEIETMMLSVSVPLP